MRTIRDNYYVVTGHTYEEYCKKYRRGIGKGRLLSFSEDEVKYLKKNKHYWEVIGPDGKTLYCQVSKLKPKHIIIPSVMAVAIAGGVLGGIYIPKLLQKKEVFTGEVKETEWKDSFENLIHINDRSRNLNFKASGKFGWEGEGSYQDLIVDGNLEQVTEVKTSGEKDTLNVYYVNQLPLQYRGSNPNVVTTRAERLCEFMTIPFGDFYSTFNEFTFDKETKTYSYDYKSESNDYEFKYINSKVKFNSDKKIESLECSYQTTTGKPFSGSFTYTYGNSHLEDWGVEFEDALKSHTFVLQKDDSNKKMYVPISDSIGLKEGFLVKTSDSGIDYDGINAIRLQVGESGSEEYATFWYNNPLFFVNDVNVSKDNYTIILNSKKHVEGIRLLNPLKKGDKFTVRVAFDEVIKPSTFTNPVVELSIYNS